MSFEELHNIAKDNHENQTHQMHTLKMTTAVRARLREKFPPVGPGMPSAAFTEAFEMSAARHGGAFMANLGDLTGIRIWIDDSLPENTWRLIDHDGQIVKEGVVSEGDE